MSAGAQVYNRPVLEGPDFGESFATQYISLMIIILTFVIGSFAGQKSRDAAAAKIEIKSSPEKVQSKPKEHQYSTLNYDDFFDVIGDQQSLSYPSAGALLTFLKSHDIKVRGEIGVMPKEALLPSMRLERSMERASMITEFLIEGGVPENAIEIYTREELTDHQATFTFLAIQSASDSSETQDGG